MSFWYRFAVSFCWCYAKLFCSVKVIGAENIPSQGGFILTANHISYFDPFIIAKNVPFWIHYMATEGVFNNPLSAYFMKSWGCVPVKRNSADRGAIKEALSLLRNNEVIGLFPQGGIVKNGRKDEFQAGAALLASRSLKPVLPVSITGTRNLYSPFVFKRKEIRVEYKNLIPVSELRNVEGGVKEARHNLIKIIETKTIH